MAQSLLKAEIEKEFQARDSGSSRPARSTQPLPTARRGLKRARERRQVEDRTSKKSTRHLKAPKVRLARRPAQSGASQPGGSADARLQARLHQLLAPSRTRVDAETGRVIQAHTQRRLTTASPPVAPAASIFTEADFARWQAAPFLKSPLAKRSD